MARKKTRPTCEVCGAELDAVNGRWCYRHASGRDSAVECPEADEVVTDLLRLGDELFHGLLRPEIVIVEAVLAAHINACCYGAECIPRVARYNLARGDLPDRDDQDKYGEGRNIISTHHHQGRHCIRG